MLRIRPRTTRYGAQTRPPRQTRRGATIVEVALVAPLMFTLVFASVEFGRLLMAKHGMDTAVREGCRLAVLASASSQDVQDVVTARLNTFGVSGHTTTIEPTNLANAQQWDPVTVTVSVTYDAVSWLPAPKFLQGITLSETSTMPRETDTFD